MAVRRVRRVIRKIDPWTVLKVSLIFNAIGGLVFILGVWVMWSLAVQRGLPAEVTDFFANFALVFTPEGELYFRVVVLLTVITATMLTGLFTLGALMYNLISDLVGGIEIIVLEETYPATMVRAPLRPAVHIAPATEVDTLAEVQAALPEAVEEQEPITWHAPAAVSVDDDTVEDEAISVEDDAPIAAAEG